MSMFAYVGCRTTRERNARGRGLGVYRLERPDSAWTAVQLIEGLINPSYLIRDPSGRTLYAVHGDQSEVSAFRVNPADGRLTFLNQQSTYGSNPVHLVLDPTGRFLLIANYATGSLAVLPIAEDGSLEPVGDLVLLPGQTGPHKIGQGFSHPHQILLDPAGACFIVPDKGLDATFVVELDQGKLRLDLDRRSTTRPGAGPRHAAFHPTAPILYLLNELDSTIATCGYDMALHRLDPIELVSTQPADFFGANSGAAIAVLPSGRFVYATNRGHDSVAIFAVDPQTYRLTLAGWVSTGGKVPRFMTLDPSGHVLFIANEASDTIVSFHIDQASGRLTQTGQKLETGSPVCVLFGPSGREATA
jgi:6-phosphogluconolactonase